MKKLRVLTLVREGLEPPDSLEGHSDEEIANWKAEYDVLTALEQLGHNAVALGVYDDLAPIRDKLRDWKPHVVFMQLEEFHGVVTYDHAVVSYLELMRQPYTGCNARGLLLSKDKPLSKKILSYHRIPNPHFFLIPVGRRVRRPKNLDFPLLVKSASDDASLGISQASIVTDDASLVERVEFIHQKIGSDAMVEQFIEGREIYVGVIGNTRLETFPPWEMLFTKKPGDLKRIATARVKWDEKYQKKLGVTTAAADLSDAEAAHLARICKRVYRALHMSGYARIDLRVTADGRVYVIEANGNPNIAYGEDFSESAHKAGLPYNQLISRILSLGLSYKAAWRG